MWNSVGTLPKENGLKIGEWTTHGKYSGSDSGSGRNASKKAAARGKLSGFAATCRRSIQPAGVAPVFPLSGFYAAGVLWLSSLVPFQARSIVRIAGETANAEKQKGSE